MTHKGLTSKEIIGEIQDKEKQIDKLYNEIQDYIYELQRIYSIKQIK